MRKYNFSELSSSNLASIVTLYEQGVVPSVWQHMDTPLDPADQQHLGMLVAYLLNYQLNLMNEATIWSRAIYPLLLLAERGAIQAWAQVPLKAAYPHIELEGIVDGVLGNCISGTIESPYLLVVEAKRGLEAQNPQFQLYGAMLAAARINQQQRGGDNQTIYGCYTIGDNWTFVRGYVAHFAADKPTLTISFSREYAERLEAAIILQILKAIVGQYANEIDRIEPITA